MKTHSTSLRVLPVILLTVVTLSSAQTGSARIALWKNGARGAYSMSGDDYACQYYGNLTTIDTTTAHRGIHMGLTTVSDFPSCLGSCSEPYWEFARNVLVPHGHQLISHSYDHQWHLKTQAALALILDTSQAHIQAHVPANECRFFGDYGGMWTDSMIKVGPFYERVEPQPIMTDSMVNYMKHQDFVGARMGGTTLAGCSGVNPSSYDPFRTGYVIWLNGGTSEHDAFRQRVQCAIDSGGHLNYEFHNIGEVVS